MGRHIAVLMVLTLGDKPCLYYDDKVYDVCRGLMVGDRYGRYVHNHVLLA